MKKKKLLIVDDELGFTEMVKLNLENTENYEVRVINCGSLALNEAIVYQPDLILMDIIMPDIEGPEIVYQMQNNPFIKDIPIIFLTATLRKNEVDQEGGQFGRYQFLAKPCSLDELIQCIEKNLLY